MGKFIKYFYFIQNMSKRDKDKKIEKDTREAPTTQKPDKKPKPAGTKEKEE